MPMLCFPGRRLQRSLRDATRTEGEPVLHFICPTCHDHHTVVAAEARATIEGAAATTRLCQRGCDADARR